MVADTWCFETITELTSNSWLGQICPVVCSILFINGSKSQGAKLVCGSTAIDHIQKKCKDEPNTAIVYWYFSFRDAASQKVDNCLRSLVTRLCSKRRDIPKELQDAYELANNGQESPSTKSLMMMLSSVIEGFEHVYLFIDALDECPRIDSTMGGERSDLMEKIYDISSWNKQCLHILTTSKFLFDVLVGPLFGDRA